MTAATPVPAADTGIVALLRPALVLVAAFTVLAGLLLPLGLLGAAQLAVPGRADGSLVEQDGHVVGSALIGQDATGPGLFHPRPSATTDTDPKDPGRTIPVPYDASSSGASNLAPTSRALIDRVRAALPAWGPGPVPGDAVTSSASGLDPDISPATALRQVPRVSRARHISEAALRRLIAAHTRGRLLGLLGEPRVNVLALNLALGGAR